MTYRVIWSPFAENWLEHFLSVSADQDTVARAAKEIDQQLVSDPKGFGESRDEAVRVGFKRSLGVLFEVLDDVRTVVVYDVWRIDRK
jgi:plasmid stabilization system protein ParE